MYNRSIILNRQLTVDSGSKNLQSMSNTKYILDSGDINEYKQVIELAHTAHEEIWGGTTNPSLIAKKLTGKKVTQQEAFALQKEIVLEILSLVPGAVSAEVYADPKTPPQQMIEQGREIATWHERVVVKLPTTIAGFKARTELRKLGIPVNNTLVFSQEQIFAICLHEALMQKLYQPKASLYPSFISPFVGRLDDSGENGMDIIKHTMRLKAMFKTPLWSLEASVRTLAHMAKGLALQTELITAPANIYKEWLLLPLEEKQRHEEESEAGVTISEWNPSAEMGQITSIEIFDQMLLTNQLDIRHELTDKGIIKFTQDWQSILQ